VIGERVALLLGLLVAPLVLLWLGHRLRDRSAVARGGFWGGVIGHAAGLLVTVLTSMVPPVWWAGGPLLRDFAVHWSPVLLAAFGIAAGARLAARRRSDSRPAA
jgi:hypothetical protein